MENGDKLSNRKNGLESSEFKIEKILLSNQLNFRFSKISQVTPNFSPPPIPIFQTHQTF